MFQFLKNKLLLGVVAGVLAVGMTIADADAKRVGGGRSIGKQSNTVTQRQQTPQQPNQAAPGAAPQQAAPAAAGAGAAGAAAAKPANRWLGPIAGLAAGLGIAALLSHFGMGGAFASMMANVIIIALIAFAAMWLIRRFRGNKSQSQTPAYAGAGNDASNNSLRQSWDSQQQPSSQPASSAQPSLSAVPAAAAGAAAVAEPFGVPAGFDAEGFLRSAKVYFNRLQAAWDKGDQADINEFTTPQMFAEIKMDLEERGKSTNRTDVVQLDAELLGIEQTATEYMASVRFSGLIREAEGAPAEPFNEVWNLTKPVAGSGGWVLAGIQQL
ncbi:Tim44 domain-containing protein [Pandoraea fibrosis]|uniref:Membrane protein n=1 Tax=Pandoraea fibrosis TaxID=1891094 RepID=A0A5E4TFC2_9BURK|nr:TIM44-like domain-containing protein [Pandoraea fibrosis]QHF11893.1 TIM44-like domain-containing protein [Pandoraea fibrosis]VVD86537.1 membrane protein [Pandoraea fibrosis]